MSRRTSTPAVLLMAYGSPASLDEVASYLSQVRGGRPVVPDESERLRERYRRVGGRTPLLEITQGQATALEALLNERGLSLPVFVGMKHWHPFIEDTVGEIIQEGVGSIIGLALAPHYSRLSIGGYEAAVLRGLSKHGSKLPFSMVRQWHTEIGLIRALSGHLTSGLSEMDEPESATVLFTAHSLPRTAVSSDDPYLDQLLETCRLVADSVGAEHWEFAFQSAGEPKENWLAPQILETIRDLARKGAREILVCPVGFVSDHLEILYDLDIEAKEYARSAGVRLERTASLNTDPQFIMALASVVESDSKGMHPRSIPNSSAC